MSLAFDLIQNFSLQNILKDYAIKNKCRNFKYLFLNSIGSAEYGLLQFCIF